MDDLDIIRKVRAEHERLDDITNTLVHAVGQPFSFDRPAWLNAVCKAFEHYRAHLIHRIALEEIGGFLNAVIERRPTLSRQVDELREDHMRMIDRAGEIMQKLRQTMPDDEDALNSAVILIKMALAEAARQENAESLLVSYAFNQEIGVGD